MHSMKSESKSDGQSDQTPVPSRAPEPVVVEVPLLANPLSQQLDESYFEDSD
jgi:serine/threonine-protein kinase SRPK3